MFKGHPKGLYALALANTGERFGYYTMLAIFILFMQAKFGFSEAVTSNVYGGFLACVYFLPLIGGILADKFGYGKMVVCGVVVMFLGYLFMAIPSGTTMTAKLIMFGSLFLIALGTGLFKGNLQVLVGNLYDDPRYSAQRDNGFSIFYMAINVGALFAPTAAEKITQWIMTKAGLFYNAGIPSLSHQLLNGTITADGTARLTELANAMPAFVSNCAGDLTEFANYYIAQLSTSYHYAFAVACFSLILSMAIYFGFRKTFKAADYNTKQKEALNGAPVVELTPAQTRERITALLLVFFVVIFFWMSFHQNGLTLTFFARDYTASSAEGLTRIGFDVWNLAILAVAVYALFAVFQSDTKKGKGIAGGVLALAIIGLVVKYLSMDESVPVLPQIFQQFNPFFVVALTPVSLAVFGALAAKKKEPSAPRKIGYGMLVAALGYCIMVVVSLKLASPAELKSVGGVSPDLVSPNWLISTYLVLTFAELLLSPMGISFVSKVAPPKYKGAMMGCWFAATAIGNYLSSFAGKIWGSTLPLWCVWGLLILVCLISAVFIFSIMKRLEKATSEC